jgi:ATP-binding cassette subfamily C protein CydCD
MKVITAVEGQSSPPPSLGVLRVISASIGVGVLSALIAGAQVHQPYADYAIALAIVAPLSGILHWFESWLAHDMAFRLLAEMRIDAFRKLDALAPAYLVRRRTGDLMALATHDIELVDTSSPTPWRQPSSPSWYCCRSLCWPGPTAGWRGAAVPALAGQPFLMQARRSPGQPAREAAGELGAFAVDPCRVG